MSGQRAADVLAGLVAAIGSAAFPARFLDTLRVLGAVELCSVFRRHAGGIELLFAEGEAPRLPDFSLAASRDYAREYWRSDAQLARLARRRSSGPRIVRLRASEIADPVYRAACYERADVTERLSILWPGEMGLVASGYRTSASGPFTGEDIARIQSHAGLLYAALLQHLRADAATGFLFDEGALVEKLLTLDCRLSAREAEVAAGLMLGETQDAIARHRLLSPTTVVTYRRRAYGKLGVTSRRDLVALHRRLLADPICERATTAYRTDRGRG
ncbi:LuxR C-terminal-related transcriptional regulator [Sphingomonas psychrotolerans]|uniref:LuxR C-terminal-related transcriptional regulator n=1 Tax=Sphingomonas psychrotolerans TaxID=1327635 RepID=A0ABU3N6M3_9SPHN|nr:LuxR C-terminal-related transcriptional regulator [Sphingomonas psychrotolerans]MDT8760174.1 LuxR C-terminal-related transcriptional regulator [Sphingomonas psychrotolerans]